MDAAFEAIRARFYVPEGTLYLDGNSLGLPSRDAEREVLRVLDEWKRLGVRGWLEGEPPWFSLCEDLAARVAPIIGAAADCVAVTGSTTGNLHQLLATLYKPSGRRVKILADRLNFPTDLYALRAQIALRGGDPDRDLVLIPSRDGRTLDEEEIISRMDETVAAAFFSLVLYRSGQFLDAARITSAARARNILIGWDLSHSIGIVPSELDRWDADFAVWCHYKYLNAGPGALAGLYRNRRHAEIVPALPGWWGSRKEGQFAMGSRFDPAPDAGAFQVGTPPVLGIAALAGSLSIIEKIGLAAIRSRSLELTARMIAAIDDRLPEATTGFRIGTPREPHRRGGHVALEHPSLAARVNRALKARGVIPDFRPPDTIRLCPAPLYIRPQDVDRAIDILRSILDSGDYLRFPQEPEPVA